LGAKEDFHRIYPVPYEHVFLQVLAVLKLAGLEVLHVDPVRGTILCNDGSLVWGYDGYWDVEVFRSVRGTEVKIIADNYFPLGLKVFREQIHRTVNALDRELQSRYPGAWYGEVPPPPGMDLLRLRVGLRPARRALPAFLFLLNGLLFLTLILALDLGWQQGGPVWTDYAFLLGVLPFLVSSFLEGMGLYRLGVCACAHLLAIGLAMKALLGFAGFLTVFLFPALLGASMALAEATWERFRRELASGTVPSSVEGA